MAAPSSPAVPFEALRAQLQRRRAELRQEIADATTTVHELDIDAGTEVADQKDESVRRTLSEIADAEQQRDIDELAQVEAALRRLDERTYGQCADCGEPIAAARLQAQPAALRCAACQTLFERLRA